VATLKQSDDVVRSHNKMLGRALEALLSRQLAGKNLCLSQRVVEFVISRGMST
jgi:hypothetical protein